VHDVRSNIPTLQPFSFEGSRAILHKVEKKICIGPEKAHCSNTPKDRPNQKPKTDMTNTYATAKIATAYVQEMEDTLYLADMGKPEAQKANFAFVFAEDAEGRRWIHPVRFFENEKQRAHNLVRHTLEDGQIEKTNWIRIIF
jgi:hypothetical protein